MNRVEVLGCDGSGKCTRVFHEVDSSAIFEEVIEDESEDDVSSIPASGLMILALAVSAAIMTNRGGRKI